MNSTFELAATLGTDLSNRRRAAALRREIARHVEATGSRCVVDLAAVRTVSDSFADELFGILVEQHGTDWFKDHVALLNVAPDVRDTILGAVAQRLDQRQEGEIVRSS